MKNLLTFSFIFLSTIPAFSLTVTITTTPDICNYSNGTLQANADGGTVPYSVVWSNGATTWQVSGLAAGTTLTATVTDASGATATAAGTIQSQPNLYFFGLSFAGSAPCEGMCNGTGTTSLDIGGVPPYWGTYDGVPMYQVGYYPGGLEISNVCWNALGNVYIEDANGCNVSDQWPPYYYIATPVIDDVVVTNVCNGNKGTATVISNAYFSYTFYYMNSSGIVFDSISGSQIGNLTPGTYTVRVTSFTSHFDSFQGLLITEQCSSDTQQFTIAACAVPTNPATTNIASSKAKLNWNTNDCAVGYRIHYKQSGGTWITNNVSSNIGYKTIKGLSPNTSYVWKVRSKCTTDPVVFSPWSSSVSFNTTMKLAEAEKEEAILNIFPNPTSGNVSVEIDNTSAINIVMIQNLIGQVMLQENFPEGSNNKVEMDVSSLQAGVYLITAFTSERSMMKMFVKQ
ncbi:MAG TPA: T9SS type A sorting domain-containing protein [Chitinophagales bacterium]|nr:T9SS type A sorting domain-containing protein [Chitinophagales bacterium]